MEYFPPPSLVDSFTPTDEFREGYRQWYDARKKQQASDGIHRSSTIVRYCKTREFKIRYQRWRIARLRKFLLEIHQRFGDIRNDPTMDAVKRTIGRAEKKLEVLHGG